MRVLHIQCTYSEDLHKYTMQPTEQCSSTVGPSFKKKKSTSK